MSKYPHRKSPRLSYFDYSTPGAYFITVCAHRRTHLFGNVVGESVQLSKAGDIVLACLEAQTLRFAGLTIDHYVLMPNHLHLVVFITPGSRFNIMQVMQAFKSESTVQIIRAVKEGLVPAFDRLVWQRSFYEHVVRDDEGLQRIRQYIVDNPPSWHLDRENEARESMNSFYKWLDSRYPPRAINL